MSLKVDCCSEKSRISEDILFYLGAISAKSIHRAFSEDLAFLLEVQRHLKKCSTCKEAYELLRGNLLDDYPEISEQSVYQNEYDLKLLSSVYFPS